MTERGSFGTNDNDGSQPSNEPREIPIVPELLQKLQEMSPELLSMTSINGVNLGELLGASRLEENTYDLTRYGVPYSLNAELPRGTTSYGSIQVRYLQNMKGSTQAIHDDLQLLFHSGTRPWASNQDQTLFVNWTETDEMRMRELYVHFVDSGKQFGVNKHGTLRQIPQQSGYIAMKPGVVAEASLQETSFDFNTLSIAYENFPKGHSGKLIVPTTLWSPRARAGIHPENASQPRTPQHNNEPFGIL